MGPGNCRKVEIRILRFIRHSSYSKRVNGPVCVGVLKEIAPSRHRHEYKGVKAAMFLKALPRCNRKL